MKIVMVLCRPLEALPHDSRVLREARALAGAGHRVSIVVVRAGDAVFRERLDGGLEVIAVPVPDIRGLEAQNVFRGTRAAPLGPAGRCIQRVANRLYRRVYFRRTLEALLAEGADAYHCHDFHTLRLGVCAGRALGSFLVYDSHEIFTETMAFAGVRGRLKKPLYTWRERRLIAYADRVITVGDGCARFLARLHDIPLPLVIENVTDSLEDDRGAARKVRMELGIGEGQKVLIYQGLLAPGRGVETLLEALPLLPCDVVLALVGHGPQEPLLRKRAGELGLSDRVRFVEQVPRERLLTYTLCADVGMIPLQRSCLNYYHALPNKIFEYMAVGLPFAVSDFPEMRHLAVDQDMGVVFDPVRPASIAEAVLSLLTNPARYARNRASIARGVTERYNWPAVREKLLALYAEAAAARTGHRRTSGSGL